MAPLHSVVLGFPIGAIATWEKETAIETASKIGPVRLRRKASSGPSALVDQPYKQRGTPPGAIDSPPRWR